MLVCVWCVGAISNFDKQVIVCQQSLAAGLRELVICASDFFPLMLIFDYVFLLPLITGEVQ